MSQRVAVFRAQRLAVLAVGHQHVVHSPCDRNAALVAAGVGALGDDPRSALLAPASRSSSESGTPVHSLQVDAVRELDRSSPSARATPDRVLPALSRKRMREVEGKRPDSATVRITGRSTRPWISRRCCRGSMSGTPLRSDHVVEALTV